jgi:two-component sensor histidine kinase
MVSLGLMLHELATNAVKYGAWSQPGGHLAVHWRLETGPPRHLLLSWREQTPGGIEPAGEARGFGSLLLSGTVRQLHGSFERRFLADGMELEVDLNLDPEA